MSKWINKEAFVTFQEEKKEEKQQRQTVGIRRSEFVWATPEKGTETIAKEYSLRFLSDPNDIFYKLYYYHMFRVGEKWFFDLCPKTFNFEHYCPVCSITQKLWMGTANDKKSANLYKRKRKYVGNAFIVKDPRDEGLDEEDKAAGKVKLYEFPNKVEMKLKEELTDTEEGLGYRIFDPGKEGHNFILKVLATKASQDGDSWPDYAQSLFSRKANALGSESEIDAIMAARIDINEYIQSLKKSDSELEKALKDEMIYELIKDEWNKAKAKADESESNGIVSMAKKHIEEDDIDDSKFEVPETLEKKNETEAAELKAAADESPFKTDEEMKEEKKTDDLEQSDAELLAELADL